jgi:hypothetical protein
VDFIERNDLVDQRYGFKHSFRLGCKQRLRGSRPGGELHELRGRRDFLVA